MLSGTLTAIPTQTETDLALILRPEAEAADAGFKPGDEECKPGEKTIYRHLAEYQRGEQWELQTLITKLHYFAAAFIARFELRIEELVIRIDKLPKRTLGQYRQGRNGLGLKNEVTISTDHISQHPLWDVLGTLLHELIHVFQGTHGRTPPKRKNDHNAEFRAKAAECGLIVGEDGVQGYAPDSPFFTLISGLGVEIPETWGQPIRPVRQDRAGRTKRTRYECPCGRNTCDATTTRGLEVVCKRCGKDLMPVGRKQKQKSKSHVAAIFPTTAG